MDIPLGKPMAKTQSPDDFVRTSSTFSSRGAIFGLDFRRKQALSTCRRLLRVSVWLLAFGRAIVGRGEGEIDAKVLSIAQCSNFGSDVGRVLEERISGGN